MTIRCSNRSEGIFAGDNSIELQKANKDLRGQVQFLRNRLNGGRGGDLLPFWMNEVTGKPEMFMTVTMREDNFSFEPAWSQARQQDAMELPGIGALLANTNRTNESFIQAARPVSDPGGAEGVAVRCALG